MNELVPVSNVMDAADKGGAAAVFAVSTAISREAGRDLWWHLPDVIAAYHFGYGLGSLRGWWDALVRRRPDPAFGRLTR